jgi:hypothetical protein
MSESSFESALGLWMRTFSCSSWIGAATAGLLAMLAWLAASL